MSKVKNLSAMFARCMRDEQGTEVLEYALLLGLIVIGALGVMGALGVKVVAKWQALFDSL